MTAEAISAGQAWDGERDEVDIDSDFDQALEAGDDERLSSLLDELIRLLQFQSRAKDVAELQTFVAGVEAFATGRFRESLFLLTQELQADGIGPGLLLDKLLLWLGRRLDAEGDEEAALWAYTECEDEECEDDEERLREALGYDDYTTERSWNEAIFAHYKALVEAHPERANAWEILALQHSILEQPDAAIEAALKATSLDPSRRQAHQVLIEIWGERGDPTSLDALEAHLRGTLRQWREEDTQVSAVADALDARFPGFAAVRERYAAELNDAYTEEDSHLFEHFNVQELANTAAIIEHVEECLADEADEAGDPDAIFEALEVLMRHLETIQQRMAHNAWLLFAMAEFLYIHHKDAAQARLFCETALLLAEEQEDANELMCYLLRALEDWPALVEHLEQMIQRGEDRVELFELYDDLADVYEEGLGDETQALAARDRANVYAEAWSAAEHVLAVFRSDPRERHVWRVLRGLLHETGRWNLLFETALERLDHEDDNGHIHEIYEGLFVVLQGHMEAPPWRVLEAHLQERIDEEPTPALRLLLGHHLGWVRDQIRVEEEDDDEQLSGQSRVDPASLEQSEDDARSFARKWAFFAGHPMHEKRLVLHFGVFLLALPVTWLLLDGFLVGPVLIVTLVVASVLLSLAIGGYIADWLAPADGPCALCQKRRWEFRRLSTKSPVYSWARTERGRVPYWGRCKACGFDSRNVYQPATSGLVKMATALQDAEDELAIVLDSLRRFEESEESAGDLSEALYHSVEVWNLLLFCQEARPEVFEAYQAMLLEELPVFAPLQEKARPLWERWTEGKRVTHSADELFDWGEELPEERKEIAASLAAMERFETLLSLHIGHLREKILASKAA